MCISNDLQNTKDMQGLKKCISPKYCTVNTIDFQSHSAKKKKKKMEGESRNSPARTLVLQNSTIRKGSD